ncbi:helix-turn-helix transcriptional regulator [Zobellella sp. DQSA1]|uniref:helix-turn-helix transcriptional regulator n=1 Tax=Zobellella sp. DQSA1 TaxID=3342386 RepID=UPI0035BF38A8
MRKADRLFQLVNVLRVRQPVTAKALSEELSVSVRTVYRYIDDLSVAGIPVYGEPGIGYRLQEGFELRPLVLTPEELDALLLGAQMVSVSTGASLTAAARTLLSKIRASLPEQGTPSRGRWAHALTVEHRGDIAELWDLLQEAICARRVVRFRYGTADGKVSQREVWPLGLFYWGGKWTLGSWCLLRQAFREFRLDRMSAVEALDHGFEPTQAINLEAYMARQAAAWHEGCGPTDTTVSAGLS